VITIEDLARRLDYSEGWVPGCPSLKRIPLSPSSRNLFRKEGTRLKIAYVYDVVYPWVKGGVEKRIREVSVRLL